LIPIRAKTDKRPDTAEPAKTPSPSTRSIMSARHSRTSRAPAPDTEQTKTARLRELRLSNEAAGREAGTWGAISVGEITHTVSRATYVYQWTGRQELDLERLRGRRISGMTIDEHEALSEWLLKHRVQGFELSVFAWNLSTAEARRVKQLRIAEHKAAGRTIINDQAPPET
jgi:hypothetical protein